MCVWKRRRVFKKEWVYSLDVGAKWQKQFSLGQVAHVFSIRFLRYEKKIQNITNLYIYFSSTKQNIKTTAAVATTKQKHYKKKRI